MKKTIIIQGPTSFNTTEWDLQKIINTIRLWYTDELIVSTWKGESTNFYGVDKFVKSEDPGPGPFNGLLPIKQHCNLFRQLVGLKNALESSSGDFIFKVRPDCVCHGDIFRFLDTSKNIKNQKIFDKKITVGNIMTIDPDAIDPSPLFRVSDWWYLGTKKDISKMIDVIDVVKESDFSKSLLGTEQILALSLLKKQGLINIEFDIENKYTINRFKYLWWNILLNNFKIVDTNSTAQIYNVGKWKQQPEDLHCYITQSKYESKLINYMEKQ